MLEIWRSARWILVLSWASLLASCACTPCSNPNKAREWFTGECQCSGNNCSPNQEVYEREGQCLCRQKTSGGKPSPTLPSTPVSDIPTGSVSLYIPMGFANNGCSFAESVFIQNYNAFPVMVKIEPSPGWIDVPPNTRDQSLLIGVTHTPPQCDKINYKIVDRIRRGSS